MKKLVVALGISALIAALMTGCLEPQEVVDQGGGDDSGEGAQNPALTQDDCFNDSVLYEDPDTSLKFCYKPEWGEPVKETLPGESGEKYVIMFSEPNAVSPEIAYQTNDYQMTENVFEFCYDCINPVMPEENIKEDIVAEFPELGEGELSVTKVLVFDQRGVRLHYNLVTGEGTEIDRLSYFVPNAFDNYNFEISGDYSIAGEIDDMAQLMVSY